MKSNICLICHEQNHKIHKLKQIEQLIRRHGTEPDNTGREIYNWGHHARCRYGIPCNKIDAYNRENDRLARSLEPYLTSIAKSGDKGLIYELLQYLRGDYPQIYRTVEAISCVSNRIKA